MRQVKLLCLLACLGQPSQVRAQVPKQDAIYVTGQADMGSPGLGGGQGALEWLHALSPASTLDVGAFSVSISGSSWTYGRIGGFLQRGSATWWGTVDLGAGRSAVESFAYQRYGGGALIAVRPHRLYAGIGVQRIRLGQVDARTFETTVQAQPFQRVSARAGYHVALLPATRWQYFSARNDVRFGALTVLGGFTLGDAGSRLASVPAWQLAALASREFFAGASVARSRFAATCTVSLVREPIGSVGRVAMTLGIPFGQNRRPDLIDR